MIFHGHHFGEMRMAETLGHSEVGMFFIGVSDSEYRKNSSRRVTVQHVTSSTAQGGGGSFKNRKPIGEVGCCESRMAQRIH